MTDTTSPALTGQPTNYPLGRLPVEIDPRRRAPEPDEVHHDALAPAPHRCPAAVATWSGWVELGRMTGFGEVAPLPGIRDELVINTAITLPIGVEAYAVYAIGAWMSLRRLFRGTRRFAAISGRRCVAE